MDTQSDSPDDVDDINDRLRDVTYDRLEDLGTGLLFRDLDLQETNSDTVELPNGAIAEPEKFGVEIVIDEDDGPVALDWHMQSLVEQVGRSIADSIADANLERLDSLAQACYRVDSDSVHVILPGVSEGYLGDIPPSLGVSLATDSVVLEPNTALVADADAFGWCAHRRPIEVLQYRDEQAGEDIAQIRFRRDYVITGDDNAYLVDL